MAPLLVPPRITLQTSQYTREKRPSVWSSHQGHIGAGLIVRSLSDSWCAGALSADLSWPVTLIKVHSNGKPRIGISIFDSFGFWFRGKCSHIWRKVSLLPIGKRLIGDNCNQVMNISYGVWRSLKNQKVNSPCFVTKCASSCIKVPGVERAARSGVPSAIIFSLERQALRESFLLARVKLYGHMVIV